jgi:glycosyltransferase involved in cell wall biosynthesis
MGRCGRRAYRFEVLTVLQVADPCAPVGPDAVGGAEQILSRLDAALVARGHRSIVIACAGSRARGALVTTPPPLGPLDEGALAEARRRHRLTIARVLAEARVDVVHLHGVDFAHYLPPAPPPTLVTLHLPLDRYDDAALGKRRPGVQLVCVSAAQRRERLALDAEVVENGVDVDAFVPRARKHGFALLAAGGPEIAAAEPARLLHLVGGARLGSERRRRLLAAARCLVVPSLVDEASSLLAMESLAAGTPVVTLRAPALPEIIEDGVTGFIVDDVAGLARPLAAAVDLDPRACRAAAERRFSAARMVDDYLARYRALAGGRRAIEAA